MPTKRKPNSWIKALKVWNGSAKHFAVPKKGTAGYKQVKALMGKRTTKWRPPSPHPSQRS